MESNKVFITEHMNVNYLKRYSLFFDSLVVYPRELQAYGILNSSSRDPYDGSSRYYGDEIIEWLFKNKIIQVIGNKNELESIFNDKCIVGFNLKLKDFILENSKSLCTGIDIDKCDKEIIDILSESDNKDNELIRYMNSLRYKLFRKDFEKTAQQRGVSLFQIPEFEKQIKKMFKLVTSHEPVLKDFTGLNHSFISEGKIASALHCDELQSGFYNYKFRNNKHDAKSVTNVLRKSLEIDFFNNQDIDNLNFNQIAELRKTKHWKSAMNQLLDLTEHLTLNQEIIEDEVKEIKSKIHDELFNSIEEVGFKKDFKETAKNVTKQFTIEKIPLLSAIDTANPLYKYLFKRKKNSLVYFMKDYRCFQRKI